LDLQHWYVRFAGIEERVMNILGMICRCDEVRKSEAEDARRKKIEEDLSQALIRLPLHLQTIAV